MAIQVHQPVVVGVPLDDTTNEVLEAAVGLARRLETALVPVHAVPPWPFPTARRTAAEGRAARDRIVEALARIDVRKVEVAEPIVEEASPTRLLLDVADRLHAQMLVVGAGRGPTVASWALGTVADRTIRAARCPVFLARGSLPGPGRPILCPVDGSAHSGLGLEAALRMARLWDAPLRVLTVVPPPEKASDVASLDREASDLERRTAAEIAELARMHDTQGVAWEARVVAGDPATVILEAAERCSMVVLGSRAFDMLVPASLGDVSSRVVRSTHTSLLAVRDLDPDPVRRDAQLRWVVGLRDQARAAFRAGKLERASRFLRVAAAIMPGHAPIEDDLAAALDRAGKSEEAERHRAVARILRDAHS